MIKRFAAFLLAAMMLCTLPVCALAEETSLLDKLAEANLLDTILQHTERIAYKNDVFAADDSITSSYYYADRELVVSETEATISITRDGQVFGFDNDRKLPFLSGFLDDAMDEHTAPSLTYARYDWELFLDSHSNNDGKMVIETYADDEEILSIFEEMLYEQGYENPQLLRCRSIYVVEEDSFEIESISVIVEFTDGTSRLFSETMRVEDPQPYEIAQELTDALFAGDKRTITIIVDPDTENQQTITAQVGKGCTVLMHCSEAHPNLYQDRACTQLFVPNEDYDSDLTLYTICAELDPYVNQADFGGEEMVQCEVCGNWYEAGNVFRNHICTIDEIQPYPDEENMVQCEVCGNWYEAGNVFRNHICTIDEIQPYPDEENMVQCEVCGNWYEAGNVFRNHICTIDEIQPYPDEDNMIQCKLCGNWFLLDIQSYPEYHNMVQCTVCGQWFEFGDGGSDFVDVIQPYPEA